MAKGWTPELPVQSGFYWLRPESLHAEGDDSEDTVAYVAISADRSTVSEIGSEDEIALHRFEKYMWQGPLEPKEEPCK